MNSIEKKGELASFFDNCVDISTTDIKKYMTRRGIFGSYIFENRVEEVSSISSSAFFSVQGITHFVLPWSIDGEEIRSALEHNAPNVPNDPIHIESLTNKFKKPIIFDKTIVLDFSDKGKILNECIDIETGLIRQDLEEEGFETLMKSLEIKKKDIEIKINELSLNESDGPGYFLIIKTDWRRNFGPKISNLNNPYFEFRHPYLFNPYVELETVKWLVEDIEYKIKGIGTDSPSLNNPIYYVKPESLPVYSKRYYNKYKKYNFRTFSIFMLNNLKYYVKNLVNLDKLGLITGGIKGETLLVPFYLNLRDACPAKLFFKREI